MRHDLEHLLGEYGYGLVAAVIALEAMGLPLPGESLLVGSAIYCATTHRLSIAWVLAAAAAGAIAGDNAGYAIGRSAGVRVLAHYGRRVGLTEDRLTLGRYLFDRYGGSVVFFGRFVAVLRTFVALLAGANRMPWERFLLWNTLGGTVWTLGYGLAAYQAGEIIRRVERPVGLAVALVAVPVITTLFILLRRNERRLTAEALRHTRAARA